MSFELIHLNKISLKCDYDYQNILNLVKPMIGEKIKMNNYGIPQNAVITIAGTLGVGKSTLTQALALTS